MENVNINSWLMENFWIFFISLLAGLIVIVYLCYVIFVKGKQPREKTADELENEELAKQAEELEKGFPKK